MGRGLEEVFSKDIHRWQTGTWRDAEQSPDNCNSKPQWDRHHSCEKLSSARGVTSVGKDVAKGIPLCTVGGDVNWHNYWGKTARRFLRKLKNRATIQSSNFTSGYLSKGNENINSKSDQICGCQRHGVGELGIGWRWSGQPFQSFILKQEIC